VDRAPNRRLDRVQEPRRLLDQQFGEPGVQAATGVVARPETATAPPTTPKANIKATKSFFIRNAPGSATIAAGVSVSGVHGGSLAREGQKENPQ